MSNIVHDRVNAKCYKFIEGSKILLCGNTSIWYNSYRHIYINMTLSSHVSTQTKLERIHKLTTKKTAMS